MPSRSDTGWRVNVLQGDNLSAELAIQTESNSPETAKFDINSTIKLTVAQGSR